jgi:hypothetical protein
MQVILLQITPPPRLWIYPAHLIENAAVMRYQGVGFERLVHHFFPSQSRSDVEAGRACSTYTRACYVALARLSLGSARGWRTAKQVDVGVVRPTREEEIRCAELEFFWRC